MQPEHDAQRPCFLLRPSSPFPSQLTVDLAMAKQASLDTALISVSSLIRLFTLLCVRICSESGRGTRPGDELQAKEVLPGEANALRESGSIGAQRHDQDYMTPPAIPANSRHHIPDSRHTPAWRLGHEPLQADSVLELRTPVDCSAPVEPRLPSPPIL